MKTFRLLSRNIRDSFRNVFRNFSLSIASISCITITLIVVAISIVLSVNVNKFTTLVQNDVTIVAFLDRDISLEQISEVEDKINKLSNIESVTLKDKETTRQEFMESKTYEAIMKDWNTREENPLQDAIHIKVKNIDNIGKTASKIEKIEGVDATKYGEGMVEQLVSIFDVIKTCSYIAVIALILVTAFLISNTIKITIFSRKREIGIMRLVGASNINIKIPFLIEGLLLGVLGSIIPIVIITYGYQLFYDKFDGKLFSDIIKLQEPSPFIYEAALLLLLIGMIVGMIGSLRAVKKHLKV